MSMLVVPDGKTQPVPLKDLKEGQLFMYDGRLLLKCAKWSPEDPTQAVAIDDGSVWGIPPENVVMPRLALVTILGDKT